MSAIKRLENVSRLAPRAFEFAEMFVSSKQRGAKSWPDWCFLPLSGWLAIAERGHERESKLSIINRMENIAALGTWRYTQGIYQAFYLHRKFLGILD